jgi:hypothetical protein
VEHQRLSDLVARAQRSPTNELMSELQKLRTQAEVLRKQATELALQRKQNSQSRTSPTASEQDIHPSEYYEQMRRERSVDALHLVTGCQRYAWDHEGQVPSNLEQVIPYLRRDNLSFTGTNEFDIVYQGSLNELTNIPLGDVALIRGRGWRGQDGRMLRVYGMAQGFSTIVGSDDNFQSWEAEHIIPPPAAGEQ